MKDYTISFIKSIIKEMLTYGYVNLKEGTYSMLRLNKKSMDILLGKQKVMFLLKEDEKPINKELFERLKVWRRIKANKENVKPYIIFSDSSLMEIVNILPKNLEELKEIRGVGEKKLEKYGEEIIDVINK